MSGSRSQGARFEDLACDYLRSKGYKILDRNVYLMRKELDIVALDGNTIVFVEVKGRRSGRFGLPAEAVGPRKQRHLLQVASAYLETKSLRNRACRFDVIAVTMCGGREPRLEHLENAFEA
jgi:putative endonuclease